MDGQFTELVELTPIESLKNRNEIEFRYSTDNTARSTRKCSLFDSIDILLRNSFRMWKVDRSFSSRFKFMFQFYYSFF